MKTTFTLPPDAKARLQMLTNVGSQKRRRHGTDKRVVRLEVNKREVVVS